MTEHPTPVLRGLAQRVRPHQTGLMPGNGDRVGYWLAPPDLMEHLGHEFDFDFDPCPYPRPAGWDGLREPWGGSTVWVNPPFVGPGSSRTAWARKCIAEAERGKTVVFIQAVDRWLMLMAQAGAEFRAPPPFTWLDPQGRPRPKGIARPSMLFVLRPDRVAAALSSATGEPR
jgi:hypothetical protein